MKINDDTEEIFDDIIGEDNECINEWWKANLDYKPIHYFKNTITHGCQTLSDIKNLDLRIISLIINDVISVITPIMIEEYRKEYNFFYGKGIINLNNTTITQTGYIDGLKEYLSKMIRIYIDGFYGNKMIFNHIKEIHDKFFTKKRYWIDIELDRINNIMKSLISSIDEE